MRRQTSLYFIVIGVFLLLISGSFMSEGLSRIGLDNAVVSQRMAEGSEGFWLPSMNTPGNPDRRNYLPLGYWMESKWYAIFGGDSFAAEKIYSVLTYFILGALIIWIWKLIGMSPRTGWLPLLCWLTIPIVSWSATNNLLESTMTAFILLSVVFLLKALKPFTIHNSQFTIHIWTVLAALMMELAFMVKGFAGLFPVFLPLLYWLIVEEKRFSNSRDAVASKSIRTRGLRGAVYSTVLILLFWMATLFVVVIISPDVYHHLYNYIHFQLIGGLLHEHTVASHFYIAYVLLVQLLIPIAMIVVLSLIRIKKRPVYRYLFFWRHKKRITAEQALISRMGWLFLAFGFAGLLPIMFGLKQKDFYIIPLLPFFAISIACLIYNLVSDWLESINKVAESVLWGMAVLLVSAGIVLNVNSINKVSDNHLLLGDMRYILPCLAEGETVTVSSEILKSAEAAEYFYRYKRIVFDTLRDNHHMLAMYDLSNRELPDTGYVKVDLPTMQYTLYELVISD